MKQPIKKCSISKGTTSNNIKNKKKVKGNSHRFHPKYGTSKLEEDFAHNFLDKLGIEYVYQFEAKDIGRYYDFYCKDHNLIIEVDGDYW